MAADAGAGAGAAAAAADVDADMGMPRAARLRTTGSPKRAMSHAAPITSNAGPSGTSAAGTMGMKVPAGCPSRALRPIAMLLWMR